MAEFESDEVIEMVTHLDDITGEACGWVLDRLMRCGALDASVTPILMKKGRPGFRLEVLVGLEQEEDVARAIFSETPTLGIRRRPVERLLLTRRTERVNSTLGAVGVKRTVRPGSSGSEVKIERDDLERLAREKGIPAREVERKLRALLDRLETEGEGGADE